MKSGVSMGRPSKLTAETQDAIVADIKKGAFPYVAAQAAGVAAPTFYEWMRNGRNATRRNKYRDFFDAVTTAAGLARTSAETRVFEQDPKSWLRLGPGRDGGDPEHPGWTESGRQVDVTTRGEALAGQADVQGLIALVVEVLAPYPEARAAIAGVLVEDE